MDSGAIVVAMHSSRSHNWCFRDQYWDGICLMNRESSYQLQWPAVDYLLCCVPPIPKRPAGALKLWWVKVDEFRVCPIEGTTGFASTSCCCLQENNGGGGYQQQWQWQTDRFNTVGHLLCRDCSGFVRLLSFCPFCPCFCSSSRHGYIPLLTPRAGTAQCTAADLAVNAVGAPEGSCPASLSPWKSADINLQQSPLLLTICRTTWHTSMLTDPHLDGDLSISSSLVICNPLLDPAVGLEFEGN